MTAQFQHLTLRETGDDCKWKAKSKEIWPVCFYVIEASVQFNPLGKIALMRKMR